MNEINFLGAAPFDSFGRRVYRGGEDIVPGMIRMDRALLYIRQQLAHLIESLRRRNTKGLGEGQYVVNRVTRQILNICQLSGDRMLADKVMSSVGGWGERTPRLPAIESLKTLLLELEKYFPIGEGENMDALATRENQDAPGLQTEKIVPQDTAQASTVFVIMPFNSQFDDVWKGGIQRAAKAKNFRTIRVDMINRSTNITDDIVESIEKCKLTIVDVTKNNPNVMFELGYAVALKKPNIIISQSVEFLPFDIRNIRTIVYSNTWSGIEELKIKIEEFLSEYTPAGAKSHTKHSALK